MASQQVAGAQAKGVYAFMKHFALNGQETNRLSELAGSARVFAHFGLRPSPWR